MNTETVIVENDEHENEFYCGLCRGWVPIADILTHGH